MATKHPILLVHGAGLRDSTFGYGYWGRIPEALRGEGFTVFHGDHDAWSSIEESAAAIAARIDGIVEQAGSPKVNIIAHSKGGLDCRYLVSSLGLGRRVASLSTVGTPHHGARLLDILGKLPSWPLSAVAVPANAFYRLLGDRNPDFGRSALQLSRARCEAFNAANPDDGEVFYQSFGFAMKFPVDDALFWFANLCTRLAEGPNDGLVSLRSAAWTNFHTVDSGRRGLSHADEVDLRRRDRRGFDIRGFYLDIARDLARRGF